MCVWVSVYLELLSHFLPFKIHLTNILPILIKMVDFKNLAWTTSFATQASRKFIYRASGKTSYCHTLGNIEGNIWTFVSDFCVCNCMFYICEVIGFVDWLDRGLTYICEKCLEMCICLWPEFDCPEVTLCGWQDIKIQLLLFTLFYFQKF